MLTKEKKISYCGNCAYICKYIYMTSKACNIEILKFAVSSNIANKSHSL